MRDEYLGRYPVAPFTWVTIVNWIHEDYHARSVGEVALQFNLERNKARRLLDDIVAKGWLYRRRQSFWNGMFWAIRNWYW